MGLSPVAQTPSPKVSAPNNHNHEGQTVSNKFNDAITLARHMAIATGSSVEAALTSLAKLGENVERREAYHDPIDIRAIQADLNARPKGTELTSRDLASELGIEMPPGSKTISFCFKRAGWTRLPIRQEGLTVWKKPQEAPTKT